MEIIVIMLVLAFLSESMTEYVFGTWLAGDGIKFISLAVGVGLALAYNVDVLSSALSFECQVPYVGQVLTGLIVGRGASFVHDFAAQFFPSKGQVEPLMAIGVSEPKPESLN